MAQRSMWLYSSHFNTELYIRS